MINFLLLFFFLVFTLSTNAKEDVDQNVNELSLGIAVYSSGSMGEVSGLHTPIYGNPGKNVKTVKLTDDSLRAEDYAVSLDYYRKVKDNLYLNAGITHSRMKGTPISGTFVVGGYVVDPAPPFILKGINLKLGPSYRFNSRFNLTPYVGFTVSYFDGKMTDTNYPQFKVGGVTYGNPNHSGTYGVGGPETSITCWGLNPNIGVFYNSGFLKGFGVSANLQNRECKGTSFRSFRWGYEAKKLKNTLYQIDYRISF